MTTSGNYRLTIDAGASYRARIRPMHQTGEVSSPVVLTGSTISFVVRDSRATWLDDLSDSVTLQSDGMHVSLTPEQTARFQGNHRYYFTVDVVFPDGFRRRYVQGPLYARPIGVAAR